ncbi:putative cellulose-binding family II protein [Botryosphaeria dothidea]|uniref:Cellulose-binding family II protein n=1 Tax=Botryosphaeria dothidea TaxID=55169 RepID=A0A8H4IS39_9PEZI|nr:putative cellulose-binding family II protein [Botryosphaeria dothidea]
MKSSLALSLLSATLGAQAAPLSESVHHAAGKLSARQAAPAAATKWDPPADLVKPLQEVWDHEIETYTNALEFKNYGYDQVIANNGSINYCVRWESGTKVSADTRALAEKAIQRQFKKWMDVLKGFEGWPYDDVPVKVVGWAVKDKSVLEGDTTGLEVYTNTDSEGIPQCDEACGRFFHQDGDYSGCAAGADKHYDQSLWITDSMEFGAGAGGDWGQRLSEQEFIAGLEKDNIETVLHELGHTFALDDFYDWTPTGVTNFIMLANSADHITEFDAWMLRDWWRNLKSRYDL